jgi:hypothetical protein
VARGVEIKETQDAALGDIALRAAQLGHRSVRIVPRRGIVLAHVLCEDCKLYIEVMPGAMSHHYYDDALVTKRCPHGESPDCAR